MNAMTLASMKRGLGLAAISALVLAGCATAQLEPLAQDRLARAQAAVDQARGDAGVQMFAPVALMDAEKALKAARQSTDPREIEHLAYLAERKSQIALALSDAGKAGKDAEQLGKDTADILARIRERELTMARADAEAKGRDLEAARRNLDVSMGELDRARRDLDAKSQELSAMTQEAERSREALGVTTEERDARARELASMRQELEAGSQALQAKTQEVETQAQELARMRQELEAGSQALQARTQELEVSSQALQAKTQELETATQALQAKTQELAAREQDLAWTRQEMEAKDQALALARQEIDTRAREFEQAQLQAQASVRETEQLSQQLAELKARQTDRGAVVTMGDVLFASNRAEVSPGASRCIENLAAFLAKDPTRTVVIEGHADSSGTKPYNTQLSEKRAEAVKAMLVSKGIGADRIVTKGFGSAFPVSPNDTASGRQRNRRVEVVIGNGETTPSASPPTR
jgi:outer membrane protein OmpA-like peptidoglycan-associated protein